MGRITINDVSEAAGVSIKTVSRVLNKEPNVRSETREKVEAAVKALNYRPSAAARALAGRKAFQIAILTDNPSPYYIFEIQEGARTRALESGYRTIFQPCERTSPELVEDVLGLIDQAHIDGVVVTPPLTESRAIMAALEDRQVPYVRIAPGREPERSPHIHFDDVAAANILTKHLISLGHKRIGFVAGAEEHVASAQRRQGFEDALAEAGLTLDPQLIADGHFTFEGGQRAALDLLVQPDRPTAIFATNDASAAGVCLVAHQMGLAIPGEISIAGFDDIAPARLLWPQLTTVKMPSRDMAYSAVDLLLGLIAGENVDQRRNHAFELIQRQSTASPSVAAS